ncbi:hypothetical protein [Bifidobacterium subtile]|jgi:alkylated DNA repair dioxygenase AlkB|nr:hypothetical protein [Bifidobacterium subtile]QOL36680.1 hypothetical protein BS3272_01360 [Bifidobacterium subtile]
MVHADEFARREVAMIPRILAGRVTQTAQRFPIRSVAGTRQGAKSTAPRNLFPGYNYVNLEDQSTWTSERSPSTRPEARLTGWSSTRKGAK